MSATVFAAKRLRSLRKGIEEDFMALKLAQPLNSSETFYVRHEKSLPIQPSSFRHILKPPQRNSSLPSGLPI